MCALTREQKETGDLIRFVVSPDNVVTPDVRRKLPGRGLWLSARREVIAQAVKKNVFARGFRRQVAVPDEMPRHIADLLGSNALNALSLANKAGLVVTGFEKIKAGLKKSEIAVLLHAFEAAPGGVDKLDRLLSPSPLRDIAGEMVRGAGGEKAGGEKAGLDDPASAEDDDHPALTDVLTTSGRIMPRLLTGDELSLALGRMNVIHIGLKQGRLTGIVAARLEKAARYDKIKEDRTLDKAVL